MLNSILRRVKIIGLPLTAPLAAAPVARLRRRACKQRRTLQTIPIYYTPFTQKMQ